ncbi:hypothetical protein ACAG25_22050 [Mycobacterium sp. pV006]|uniref:hypothetical protein n=1 Tax=Mycobacterium sp. pV006 TaxID=3238983 RepID=UPI00351AC7DE
MEEPPVPLAPLPFTVDPDPVLEPLAEDEPEDDPIEELDELPLPPPKLDDPPPLPELAPWPDPPGWAGCPE